MTPDEIKALRKELSCTAKELAAALGTDQAMVLSWERAETFPTKRLVTAMLALRDQGPAAIPRKRPAAAAKGPFDTLNDPSLWALVRKLIAHAPLRDAVARIAADYDDPAEAPR